MHVWGDHHGQIIGLKKREREAAEHRRNVDSGLASIVRTVRTHKDAPSEVKGQLLEWCADQLERAMYGHAVEPFAPQR
jgi:hypothetical protein